MQECNQKFLLYLLPFSLTSFKIFSLECLIKEFLQCLLILLVIMTCIRVSKNLDQLLSTTKLKTTRKMNTDILRKLMMLKEKQPFNEEINKTHNFNITRLRINKDFHFIFCISSFFRSILKVFFNMIIINNFSYFKPQNLIMNLINKHIMQKYKLNFTSISVHSLL